MEVIETRLAKIHTKAQIRSYFQEWEREQQNQLLCSTSSLLIFKSDNSENFKNKEGRSPGNDQLHPNFFPWKNLLLFQLSSFSSSQHRLCRRDHYLSPFFVSSNGFHFSCGWQGDIAFQTPYCNLYIYKCRLQGYVIFLT